MDAKVSDLGSLTSGAHRIDILVSGFPGKSVCHGGLGWSTVVLIRHGSRVGLVDVGSFGYRSLIKNALARHGLTPADVTDVLLTHSHWDHSVNWTMFPNARVAIGADELDWSLRQPWGGLVPELYVRELRSWPTAVTVVEGDEVFPSVTAHLAPGHTPGHLVFLLRGAERDVIFAGDAAKNRAELMSRTVDMTLDAGASVASLEMIWSLWRARPGNVLVPGHDLPMVLQDGEPAYLGEREAAIAAWFEGDLERTTRIDLVV